MKILLIAGRPRVYTRGFVPLVQRAESTPPIPFLSANRDLSDPLAPRREAAMFYGLFLRGHNVESLRPTMSHVSDAFELPAASPTTSK